MFTNTPNKKNAQPNLTTKLDAKEFYIDSASSNYPVVLPGVKVLLVGCQCIVLFRQTVLFIYLSLDVNDYLEL